MKAQRIKSPHAVEQDASEKDDPLVVTRPQLPPLEEVLPYLEEIWRTHQLTNQGPLHERLEAALCDYLGVNHLSLFANGTLALVTAMHALRLTGEVITTPYSFVATASARLWNDLTPVFVDVDPVTLNLDPEQVEAAITPSTSAILPVHVYGHPADVDGLRHVADLYGLRLIYDAAHCFGVEDDGGSVLRHGDLSMVSFHATKVFNTFEGGAIVNPDAETKQRIDYLRNFGIARETIVVDAGINAKMNEFQAAVGLAQLQHIDEALDARARVDAIYREQLEEIPGVRCHTPTTARRHNYAYFPIFVDDDYPLSRDELYYRLWNAGIRARRYFYPLIPEFPTYSNRPGNARDRWPVAHEASARVICLPMYSALNQKHQDAVVHAMSPEGR
jgi:dTDP-4-amino-4,6-dideoxygalactose transaminase